MVPRAPDMNHDERANDNDASKRPSKRPRLLRDSDQTEAQRRSLRQRQRMLLETIHDDDKDDEEVFNGIRAQNNVLFENVRYTREAVLDAENVNSIASSIARRVDRMVQVPRYDGTRLVNKLKQKCTASSKRGNGNFFDWAALGQQVGVCFNAVPCRVSFLAGPLDECTKKERKVAKRRDKNQDEEEVEEEEPETQEKPMEKNAHQLSAVERSMKQMKKTLTNRCHQTFHANKKRLDQIKESCSQEEAKLLEKSISKHGNEIDAIQFLFNPDSFTQTVENIFHFSFLIKKGDAGISVRSKLQPSVFAGSRPGPVVMEMDNDGEEVVPRQAIVALNMQDWRELCQAYGVTRGDIPHREGSVHTGS